MANHKNNIGINFYISDTHFGHKNILRYDNRPFFTLSEMEKAIIENWNRVVSKNDTVYILGDFSWYGDKETIEILNKLAGQKILVKGNHDKFSKKVFDCFAKVCDYLEITDNNNKVILSHYPMPFWNGQFRDSVHLYGHVHNSHQWNVCENLKNELRQLQDLPMRMYNVGCMMEWMDYTPRTLQEIQEKCEK